MVDNNYQISLLDCEKYKLNSHTSDAFILYKIKKLCKILSDKQILQENTLPLRDVHCRKVI